jgi:hypothetical protein
MLLRRALHNRAVTAIAAGVVPHLAPESPRPVDDAAVLDSVHDDDLAVIVDLMDHSVVAASCRVQPGQLAD